MPKPRVCVDFDDTVTADVKTVLPGCIEFLTELRKTYAVAIFSARATPAEIRQMVHFLADNGVPHDEVLPPKPDAVAYIDDKARQFTGWDKVRV